MGYLFAAYTVIWAVLFGYVFVLYLRQRRLLRDIELLKENLDKQQ
jgi:CcmD family protein